MVMAPDNAIAIPFCKNCGALLVPQLGGQQMGGPCEAENAVQHDVAGAVHEVEFRYAHLDPPGLMY